MPRAPRIILALVLVLVLVLALALALALGALAACGAGHAGSEPAPRPAAPAPVLAPARDPMSEASLAADLAWLTAPERAGRGSTTAEARATARWIASELRAAGYALIEQPIPDAPGQVNVIAELALPPPPPPPTPSTPAAASAAGSPAGHAPAVIVVAHYDHLGVRGGAIYPGADDNASGVAVALAVARDLQKRPIAGRAGEPAAGRVVWLFSGAEEIGLRGARAFVAAPPLPLGEVRAVYNLDMVGRDLATAPQPPQLIAVGLPGDPGISDAAYEAADQAQLTLIPVRLGLLQATRQAHRSDDWVFRDAGVFAVHFSTGPHDDYHSPGDTPDKCRGRRPCGSRASSARS